MELKIISQKGVLPIRKSNLEGTILSIRFNPKLKEFYEKKSREETTKAAIGAVARELTNITYAILKTRQDYNLNL